MLKGAQQNFLDNFDPSLYHKNLVTLSKAKKKKDLAQMLDIMEQYDFYYKNLIFQHLLSDQ